MVRKGVLVSQWSFRICHGLFPKCLVMILALAGCKQAVPPPSVSFNTEQPIIGIPALTVGVAMSSVTLPAATGGSGELTYSLQPEVPGLTFAASRRVLSGTPTAAGSYAMTYGATDTREVTAALSFTITVQAAPPPLTIDPAPAAAAVAGGTYLTAVLGGDANDALTVEGGAALTENVLTDDQVTALLAADWWKTPAELALASPAAFGALLAALVPVYDKHLPPAMHTVTLRESAVPEEGERFIRPIDLTTLALGAAHVGALASQPSMPQTQSCYLSADEATMLGSGDPAVAHRVGTCVSFSGSSLSTMQAVEVARTCAGGGCSGVAGRQVLAAIGATVLHGMVDDMAGQLTDMIIAEWWLGWYVGLWWEDDDDDGIGEINEYELMYILEDRAGFAGFFRDDEDSEAELAFELELGPWTHRRTSRGGEFVDGGADRLQYEYIADHLNRLAGGAEGHRFWMARIGREVVGTWSGMNDDGTYTLEIDGRGAIVLTVSGDMKHGWIEHEQHLREDERGNLVYDDMGFPMLNRCGELRMLFPDADEVQAWRYCVNEEYTFMEAQVPPYDRDKDWAYNLELIRQ